MAEMQAVARRDSVPIVHWETGRFLATLCRALDRNVLEVGTAIGYSTLHLPSSSPPGGCHARNRSGTRSSGARVLGPDRGDRSLELVEGDARESAP
jgi:predicted O-methyltransferase YrrM